MKDVVWVTDICEQKGWGDTQRSKREDLNHV